MFVNCHSCGESFEAKRSTAKWCSRQCRARGASENPPPATTSEPAGTHPFVVATREQLTKLGKLDTMLGQQALVVAERMANGSETGSAVATLSKEHTRLMNALGKAEVVDPVDEVAKKRDAKRDRAASA